MAFPQSTIKLEAARKIFAGVTIEPCLVGDKVAYYQADFKSEAFQNTSLTDLCSALWKMSISR